jgi:hypothetical protein
MMFIPHKKHIYAPQLPVTGKTVFFYMWMIFVLLWDSFPIENGLKQGDALSPLLFNFSLQYAIRTVQENQVGLKLSGAHQFLAYADDVNLLGDNIGTINKNTETVINASNEVVLNVGN